MGCQSKVILGDNLTFSITTHDPDTGEITDADAAPAYRIYEDETAVAILTGTMATLDSANTTGFYSEKVACTAANGFSAGKSYSIYITATVDSDTGGISFGVAVEKEFKSKDTSETFDARTDSLEAIRDSLNRSPSSACLSADELTCIRGDSYDSDADNAITALGDISNRTKLWIVVKKSTAQTDNQATLFAEETAGLTRLNGAAYGTVAHSVITVSDAAAGDLRWQLDEAVTDDLVPGLYHYDIQTLDSNGDTKTWRRVKQFTVSADVARVIS